MLLRDVPFNISQKTYTYVQVLQLLVTGKSLTRAAVTKARLLMH